MESFARISFSTASSHFLDVVKMKGSVIVMVFTPLSFKRFIMPSKSGKESLKTSRFPIVPFNSFPNQYKSRIIASTGISSSLNLAMVISTSS